MLRAVLFDFGGVIAESCWDLRAIATIIGGVLRENRIPVNAERLERVFVDVMEEALSRVMRTLREERMSELISRSLRIVGVTPRHDLIGEIMDRISDAPFCKIREDAPVVLRSLRELRLRLGIVSNSPINFLDRVLGRAGILGMFDTIVVSCDVGYRKPHPKIYEIALSRLGVAASETIFVGDVPEIDIAGARSLGMITVLIEEPEPYMRGRTIPGPKAEPDYVIRTLSELIEIVTRLTRSRSPQTKPPC